MRGDRGRQNDRPSAPGRRAAQPGTGAALQAHSTAPLDPIYAWGIVLEPVETMIEETSTFIEELAEETFERREPFSDDELEARFLAFFELLVEDGTLNRLPDAPPEMGRRILGPRRWLHAQRIRIDRLVQRRCEHEEGADRSARGT
ncbi:MAG: hypothetical protein PVF54_02030 [Anaerolineae bacterium]